MDFFFLTLENKSSALQNPHQTDAWDWETHWNYVVCFSLTIFVCYSESPWHSHIENCFKAYTEWIVGKRITFTSLRYLYK